MLHPATVGLLLALTHTAAGGKTLWLTEPLYPGQEFVVSRTEEALDRLMPPANRPDDVVGKKALAQFLDGKRADLGCLTGASACNDPVDAFVSSLGIERVVMLKGGQEDGSYHFKVTSYRPATGEALFAEGTGPNLDRALLGALVKVVPLASKIDVKSEPAGATVFIDGEKVGVTPYSGQVLPGERKVKLELRSHMPAEKTLDVPVRGAVEVSEKLEKVPARLVVTVKPEAATIAVDGAVAGTGKVDKAIQPGAHKLELALEGYLPHAQEADIKPGDTFTLDKTLEPTTWTTVKDVMRESQEDEYHRGVFFQLNFEWQRLVGGNRTFESIEDEKFQVGRILDPKSPMTGISIEYGHEGRHFGLMAVGLAYHRSVKEYVYEVENLKITETDPEPSVEVLGRVEQFSLRALQPEVRWALWKVMFLARVGPEIRAMRFHGDEAAGIFPRGFWLVDVVGVGMVAARLYVVEGLFLEGNYRRVVGLKNGSTHGYHVGLGYAF